MLPEPTIESHELTVGQKFHIRLEWKILSKEAMGVSS